MQPNIALEPSRPLSCAMMSPRGARLSEKRHAAPRTPPRVQFDAGRVHEKSKRVLR
jgi:hypothetical protein